MQTRARTAPRGNAESLNETMQFMRWLWAVDHGLQSVSKRMRTTVGLTGPQRLVVRVLGRRSTLSAGELATILHVHQSTLTGILRRLEDLGIVSRTTNPEDRRQVVLRLTQAGRGFNVERAGTVESAVRRALARVPAHDVAATVRVLGRVAAELEEASRGKSARGRRSASSAMDSGSRS